MITLVLFKILNGLLSLPLCSSLHCSSGSLCIHWLDNCQIDFNRGPSRLSPLRWCHSFSYQLPLLLFHSQSLYYSSLQTIAILPEEVLRLGGHERESLLLVLGFSQMDGLLL